MRWGRDRNDNGAARAVIREAQRLLEGRSLESYIARRERVPAWTLVAMLGHGSRRDLLRLASPAASPDPAGWSGTVARLACVLLDVTGDDAALLALQRRALIPLELGLLGGHLAPPTSPGALFDMVTKSCERPLSTEF